MAVDLIQKFLEFSDKIGVILRLKDFEPLFEKLGISLGSTEHFVLAWSDYQLRKNRGETPLDGEIFNGYPDWAEKFREVQNLGSLLDKTSGISRSKIENALKSKNWHIEKIIKSSKFFLSCSASQRGGAEDRHENSQKFFVKAGIGQRAMRLLNKEFRFSLRLQGKGFVRPKTLEVHRSVAWITAELAEGESLEKAPKLTSKEIWIIWTQAAKALAALHKRKLCHNDVKASNLILDYQKGFPRVRFCDFQLSGKDGAKVPREKDLWDPPRWHGGSRGGCFLDTYRLAMTVAWLLDPSIACPTKKSIQARLDAIKYFPDPFRKPLKLCLTENPLGRVNNAMELYRILNVENLED